MQNLVSQIFLLIGILVTLCSIFLSILFFKRPSLRVNEKSVGSAINNSHSDAEQKNRLNITLQVLSPISQNNNSHTKFSILGRFYHIYFPFWKKTFPPSYILIIGMIISGLTELLYSILYSGAYGWAFYIITILPFFTIIPLLIILPLALLSAGQEFTNSWGLTYFSLPTPRKNFILGRFYCLNALFLLLLMGIPVLASIVLELLTYGSFFPSLSQYGPLPSNWVYPAHFDFLGYTIFFILCLLWYLIFLFVMEIFFGFLLVFFHTKTLSLGLYYFSLFIVFFLPVIWGLKSPLVFFSSFLPSFLVQVVFPINISTFIIFNCNPFLDSNCFYPPPLFNPWIGSLILLLSMIFLIGFLLLISFTAIVKLKHLELIIQ